jgi:cell division protein FtsN
MKKILTFFALTSFSVVFSQITVTSNLPTNINVGAVIDAEVKINKGALGNFAKYQMDVPTGYVVSSVDVKGGNFTFENQRAKIVWVSVPGEAEFAVKFKIQVNSDAANPGTFTQKFYYLENNEKKEVEASPVVITIGGAGSAVAVETKSVETKVTETKPVETKVTETKVTETKPVETKVTETKVTETKPVETKVTETKPVETVKTTPVVSTNKTSSSASETGMTFKVQLGAFSNEPNKSKFASVGKVNVDFINGLYKVTTGNFSNKDDAMKFCIELQSKGVSSFVVKYKNGQRIN